MVADVKLDPANPASPTVATEFLGTSISSLPGDLEPPIRASLPLNPQVKYYDGEKRGYMLCRTSRTAARRSCAPSPPHCSPVLRSAPRRASLWRQAAPARSKPDRSAPGHAAQQITPRPAART
jgi:phosphodiesterase/alkaline phosphatase D-like protein